jgi:hypothetical protein
VEEEVGVNAPPAAAAAREGGIEDLCSPPPGHRPLQRLGDAIGHRPGALGTGEGEGLGCLLGDAGHGVELGPEGAEAALKGGAAPEGGIVQSEAEEGALLGGEVEGAKRRPLDEPVALVVAVEGDVPAVEGGEVPVGGALLDLEMLDELPQRPGPAPAEEGDELEQPVRAGYGGLRRLETGTDEQPGESSGP